MWGMGSAVSEEDRLDRSQTAHVMRRALGMAKPHRRTIIAALAFVGVSTLGTLAGPVLVRFAIDHGISKGDAGALNLAVVLYVGVTVVNYVVGRQQYLAINRAGEGFLRDLRVRVFDRMQAQSMAFYDREKAGVLVSRMTADVESMGELIQWGLLQFVSAVLLLLLSILLILALSWQLTIVALTILPLLIVASVRFQRASNAAYLDVREKVGQNLSALQEGITGVRVIQAYHRQDEQSRRFALGNRSLYDAHIHSVRVSTWYFGVVEASGVTAIAATVGVGGWLVHRGDVSIGTVAAFVLLLANLFEPVQQLSQLYNSVQSAAAALHKLFGVIDAQPDVADPAQPVPLPPRGALALEGVSFSYLPGGRRVVRDVTMTVADGERLALVGPTGAGKSTVAKLMARLYDPTAGVVTFAGIDMRRASVAELRRRVVVVPQEGFLFAGSILDNVRIAREGATDDEVRAALRTIGALDRFDDLPEGLATEVRERGSRLSAGERQLVALARAALVDPAVLVLDEATSNLDPGTEAVVEHALETLMHGRTVVVVAHRLTTVQRADRIAVVDRGRLVELGSHAELIAHGERYAALAAAWAAGIGRGVDRRDANSA